MELGNDRWNKIYEDYIKEEFDNWDEYFKIKMNLKKKFFKLIFKYSKNGKPILECGSGTGKSSAYLATLGLEVYAMDYEEAMVNQTKEISEKLGVSNHVKAFQGDIRKIPIEEKFFSVAHSSGVLEHYCDEEIRKIINEQLRVADVCIFSVPTCYFEKKMLGDERFLSKKEWRRIIESSNSKIIKESGYHYKTLSKRIIDILKNPKKIFKPIALYIFVIEKRGECK